MTGSAAPGLETLSGELKAREADGAEVASDVVAAQAGDLVEYAATPVQCASAPVAYAAAPAYETYVAASVQYASAPVTYAAAPACETYAGAPVQCASAPAEPFEEAVVESTPEELAQEVLAEEAVEAMQWARPALFAAGAGWGSLASWGLPPPRAGTASLVLASGLWVADTTEAAPVTYAAAPACETYAGAPVQYASAPGASLVETVDAAELPRPPEEEPLSEMERAMLVADFRRIDMADAVAVAAVISRHEALRIARVEDVAGWA